MSQNLIKERILIFIFFQSMDQAISFLAERGTVSFTFIHEITDIWIDLP
jgi:hypothetical protein